MADHKPPRLYSLFGKTLRPGEEEDERQLNTDMTEVEAKRVYRQKIAYLRRMHFHVIERINDIDNQPLLHSLQSPYWIR
jgi:hypothetical protein